MDLSSVLDRDSRSFCSCLRVSSEWTDAQANNLDVWAGPTGLAGRARWRGERAIAGASACCQSRGQKYSLGGRIPYSKLQTRSTCPHEGSYKQTS